MYDLDELKESMKNPEFRFVIRKNIIDALGQPKSKPKDEINLMLNKLKGTGLTLKDIPNFIMLFLQFIDNYQKLSCLSFQFSCI